MNENDRVVHIQNYLKNIQEKYHSGHAIEHGYRSALERLIDTFDDVNAINDPRHSEHGAPDYVFLKKSNNKIIRGYAEAKDITVNLDKTEKTDQMLRYHGYSNLFLTDYLEFRFFRNGEKYETISLGKIVDNKLHLNPENGERLMRELEAFLEQAPEKIRSGKRLAQIMGSKARRIRDTVYEIITETEETRRDQGTTGREDLLKIYELMRQMLVHDLDPQKFADMYAQTLVYGLFVARYGDESPSNFSRNEARDLVPKSNPFLRHFFDHIVGPEFIDRLGYIVDELCEVFSVSDVSDIVHKHLRIQDATDDTKDPIIHFYEDFLQDYDSAERKKMGAYYTPIPVVKYIVRQVDRILKEEFGITKGLASTDTVEHWVDTGQEYRPDKRHKAQTGYNAKLPRVQVLDPAVGTATFLNETIKHIRESFKGQEGRWESYVNDNLLKRLYGFELMMAPYTIAHLKLGMTLKETGVNTLNDRIGVYLTNTLEEGIPAQQQLISFGLAEAVSQESKLAAQVKSERPVMVVMGNPPYSVSSNNKSKFIENLIADYKQELNERNIQPLSDDYIKFIRFAENMISKNGSGIVAMITNNSYLDGLIHRQMRKHLLQTFDKIYVLDLHGNSKKKEVATDGGKDVNVFDIQQGVGIILAVKSGNKKRDELGELFHSELLGTRQSKFDKLNDELPNFQKINVSKPSYYFLPKDNRLESTYLKNISLGDLFTIHNAGVATGKDAVYVGLTVDELKNKLSEIGYDESSIIEYRYRPFDLRYSVYDNKLIQRLRTNVMNHAKVEGNTSLVATQLNRQVSTLYVGVVDGVVDRHYLDSAADSMHVFPLYLYQDDGSRITNFDSNELHRLTVNLESEPLPEDILNYVYAVLHSPSYREKYKEFLKSDFPRVPVPVQSEFERLMNLGRKLRELHLMKSSEINQYDTTFPVPGDDYVVEVRYQIVTTKTKRVGSDDSEATVHHANSVYINKDQYFGSVPEIAWNFHIGGYQPAQKWLKDRKGRKLSNEDIEHYQKIIKVLSETDRIMKEIDMVWQS